MTSLPSSYASFASAEGITVMFNNGLEHTFRRDAPFFAKAQQALKDKKSAEDIWKLTDIKKIVEQKVESVSINGLRITVDREGVYYKGERVHDSLTRKIMELMHQGDEIDSWVHFMDKLYQNQRMEVHQSLFDFLWRNKVPFTPDGNFLAYKRVRDNYTDVHSGKFDNSLGKEPEIEPWQVDPSRDNECSSGLHVCGRSYLPSFSGERCVVVEVDPRHVVAVPRDYNCSKMRLFKYKVVGELNNINNASVTDHYAQIDPGQNIGKDVEWSETVRKASQAYAAEVGDPQRCGACAITPLSACRCFNEPGENDDGDD
jgi:hypothetical protein